MGAGGESFYGKVRKDSTEWTAGGKPKKEKAER